MPLIRSWYSGHFASETITKLQTAGSDWYFGKPSVLLIFGDQVANGQDKDLYFLYVAPDWDGPRRIERNNRLEALYEGRITVFFLTLEEFEHPTLEPIAGEFWSSLTLLYAVNRAYVIIDETPMRYTEQTMKRNEMTMALHGMSVPLAPESPESEDAEFQL